MATRAGRTVLGVAGCIGSTSVTRAGRTVLWVTGGIGSTSVTRAGKAVPGAAGGIGPTSATDTGRAALGAAGGIESGPSPACTRAALASRAPRAASSGRRSRDSIDRAVPAAAAHRAPDRSSAPRAGCPARALPAPGDGPSYDARPGGRRDRGVGRGPLSSCGSTPGPGRAGTAPAAAPPPSRGMPAAIMRTRSRPGRRTKAHETH